MALFALRNRLVSELMHATWPLLSSLNLSERFAMESAGILVYLGGGSGSSTSDSSGSSGPNALLQREKSSSRHVAPHKSAYSVSTFKLSKGLGEQRTFAPMAWTLVTRTNQCTWEVGGFLPSMHGDWAPLINSVADEMMR